MSTIVAITEAKRPAIHLFRHLLRASSYLPDDFARAYFLSYIKSEYRRTRNPSQLTPARLAKGHQSLRALQRAANGNIKSLTKVLHMAYGRSGRRRRELVNELLHADGNTTPEPGSHLPGSIDQQGVFLAKRPVLMIFLKSQAAKNPLDNKRLPIRELGPGIPKNIWGREMPIKREQNIVKKFWASMLDKILPPLPEVEWNRLRDLANGVVPFEGFPPRRVPVNIPKKVPKEGVPIGQSSALLNAVTFLTQPVILAGRSAKDEEILERSNHEITSRFMRRRWTAVWQLCPLMSYNGETMEWSIVWGGNESAAPKGLVGSIGRKDLELFDRMDEQDKDPVKGLQKAQHKQTKRELKVELSKA